MRPRSASTLRQSWSHVFALGVQLESLLRGVCVRVARGTVRLVVLRALRVVVKRPCVLSRRDSQHGPSLTAPPTRVASWWLDFCIVTYVQQAGRRTSIVHRCLCVCGGSHLGDQVDALGRGMGYQLRYPDALLRREIKVHVGGAVPLELSEHLSGRISQYLLTFIGTRTSTYICFLKCFGKDVRGLNRCVRLRLEVTGWEAVSWCAVVRKASSRIYCEHFCCWIEELLSFSHPIKAPPSFRG